MRHRMAHQTTHPAVSIREWMNVIQAMMGGGDGHDSASRSQMREVIPLLEISHEFRHTLAGGGKVTTDRVIVFGPRTPLTGGHDNFPRFILEGKHCQRSVSVKLAVN